MKYDFFSENITYYLIRCSTRRSHQKSSKNCLRIICCLLTIFAKTFCCGTSLIGTPLPLDSFFFTHFFSGTFLGQGRYPNQNLLCYDQRPSYMILLKRANFSVSKLPWSYSRLKLFFEQFCVFARLNRKLIEINNKLESK